MTEPSGKLTKSCKICAYFRFRISDDLEMHDANEIECLIFEIATKNIILGKVTKGGVSDANNKLIINVIPTVGSYKSQPVANRVNRL